MVLFFLYMKAQLENVEFVRLKDGQNLCITVKNPLSDYEIREKVIINSSVFVEQDDNARESPYNFGLSWEGNKKKQCTMTILSEAEVKSAMKKSGSKKGSKGDNSIQRSYTADDSGSFVPILCVECRGLEPSAFYPMGNEFIIQSTGGTVFDDSTDNEIDLSESDWADYDADHDMPVSLSEIEFKWDTM